MSAAQSQAQDWHEEKGTHFIVKYRGDEDSAWAQEIIRYAEEYYRQLAQKIGYSRYQNYWTWDNRVQIFIFNDQTDFMNETKQPSWSRGGAVRDFHLLESRTIITYRQENEFLDGVLPHEIAHLMIWDYIGLDKDVPVWFAEGIAQFNEVNKKEQAQRILKELVKKDLFFPMKAMMFYDIANEKNSDAVMIFYSQAVSVIDFMISRFGSNDFGELCSELKAGKHFEEALRIAYSTKIESLDDLEKKWLRYMKSL